MMFKKVRVSVRSEIPNFHEDEDLDFIERELNNYMKILIPKINIQDLGDWRVLVLVHVRNTDAIGAFKLSRWYPSDSEYEISVSIPIPDDKQASYGFDKANEGFFSALNDRFYILEPSFENYDNLYNYILESSKQAISLAFTKGIVCGGKKIKFQDWGLAK